MIKYTLDALQCTGTHRRAGFRTALCFSAEDLRGPSAPTALPSPLGATSSCVFLFWNDEKNHRIATVESHGICVRSRMLQITWVGFPVTPATSPLFFFFFQSSLGLSSLFLARIFYYSYYSLCQAFCELFSLSPLGREKKL